MNLSTIAVLTLVGLFVVALAKGIIRARRRKEAMSLDRIRAAVLAQTSVVAGVATTIAGLVAKVRDEAEKLAAAGADTTDLDALADKIESNTASLATAAAVNTDAAAEVHQDEGGTGSAPATDGGTVIDASAVDTTAGTEAAAASDDKPQDPPQTEG